MAEAETDLSPTFLGLWGAGHQFYDHLQTIEFGPDGHGHMVYGCDQTVKFEQGFRWVLVSPGRLQIHWADGSDPRIIGFEVVAGPHPVEIGCMGPSRREWFRLQLRFEADPFPPG